MTNIADVFPSKYIKAADLHGRTVPVTIDRVELEQMPDGTRKLGLYFQGKEKGVLLNKTNANNIASVYGDETEDWRGQTVELYPAMVDFQGRSVEAIRIRAPRGQTAPSNRPTREPAGTVPTVRPAPTHTNTTYHLDDDIPF